MLTPPKATRFTNMKKNIALFGLILFSFAVVSCKEDPKPSPPDPSTSGVIIANTGLTPTGSGSLTEYNPSLKTVNNNAFQKANKYTMGAGLTSILVDGDKTFLVLGSKSEVIVVNTNTYKFIKKFTGFGTPRYIVKATDNKYYVSDWAENGVHVLNYNQKESSKIIFTGDGPEKMLIKDELLFVVNSGGPGQGLDSTITVINIKADTIATTLNVGMKPNSLQLDSRDQLWVLCQGYVNVSNPLNNVPGKLVSFDLSMDSITYYPDTIKRVDSLSLELADNQLRPHSLVINAKGDMLYFIDGENEKDGNVMRHSTTETKLVQTPFLLGFFYSMAFDMIENELYMGSPGNYTLSGEVHRYAEKGNQLDFFTAGIIPCGFGFK